MGRYQLSTTFTIMSRDRSYLSGLVVTVSRIWKHIHQIIVSSVCHYFQDYAHESVLKAVNVYSLYNISYIITRLKGYILCLTVLN